MTDEAPDPPADMPSRPETPPGRDAQDRLRPRQARFVAEYLLDLNATQAAVRAGYGARNAKSQGSRLLKRDDVRAAVDAAIAARARRIEVSQDRVLLEYARLAFSDMRRFMDWGPRGVVLKDGGALDADETACVAEVSESKTAAGGTVRLKLHDKRGALDSLARHLGMSREAGPAGEAARGPVLRNRIDLTGGTDDAGN